MNNINNSFKFKKKFGQNFLFDKNFLDAIVRDAKVSKDDEILEIGAGEGTLTEVLAKNAKKVVSYEIDKELIPFLEEKFSKTKNVRFIFKNFLKEEMTEIEKMFKGKYKVVANIPYNITTPIIFKFLEEGKKFENLTLMVQEEVAERIISQKGSANYGILSLICAHHCECKILRKVSKKLFRPVPKVNSAIVNLTKKLDFDFEFAKLVRISFAMRRKTLLNNLIKHFKFSRETLEKIFEELNLNENIRAEELTITNFLSLKNILFKKN